MFFNLSKKMLISLIVLGGSGLAFSDTFLLFQSGFKDGAFIEGSFTGNDLNGNGQISPFEDNGAELTSLNISFSGNSLVPAFSLVFPGTADGALLVYDVDSGFIGDDALLFEGISIGLGDLAYSGGGCDGVIQCFMVFDDSNGKFDGTTEAVQVTKVSDDFNVPVFSLHAFCLLALMLGYSVNRVNRRASKWVSINQ